MAIITTSEKNNSSLQSGESTIATTEYTTDNLGNFEFKANVSLSELFFKDEENTTDLEKLLADAIKVAKDNYTESLTKTV